MKSPSLKRLIETFKLDVEQAKLIKQIAVATDDGEALRKLIDDKCPETARYAGRCYHDPFRSQMWRVTMALHAIDKIVGTCGVEALGEGRHSEGYAPPWEYLNTGDSYGTTLIYSRDSDNLYIGCWATIAERLPRNE